MHNQLLICMNLPFSFIFIFSPTKRFRNLSSMPCFNKPIYSTFILLLSLRNSIHVCVRLYAYSSSSILLYKSYNLHFVIVTVPLNCSPFIRHRRCPESNAYYLISHESFDYFLLGGCAALGGHSTSRQQCDPQQFATLRMAFAT